MIIRPFPGDELRALIELVNGQLDGENLHPPEAWRLVGTPGQPPFLNGWGNLGAGGRAVAFYKDALGIVHLRGAASGGTVSTIGTATIFQLPPGYHVTDDNMHFAVASNNAYGTCRVQSDGSVQAVAGSNVWFDLANVHFRV